MRKLLVGAILASWAWTVAADDSVQGTHWVRYLPMQINGDLQGCSLTYLAVGNDHAYLNGNYVVVNGSIILSTGGNNSLGLALKIGLKDMTAGTAFERPNFAYLQTANSSTAKIEQQAADGDEGYRLFAYSATDPSVIKLLTDIMDTQKITIGYNRTSGGLDVLVPLNLTVTDSDYTSSEKVLRTQSPEVVLAFSQCVVKVLERLSETIK